MTGSKFVDTNWDSLIIKAALENGCDTLYSEDMQQHGQVIENRLTVINSFR